MSRLRTAARRVRDRLTRRNCFWFLKTNVQSWVLQGVVWGLLTVAGVSAVAAVVVAKTSAYTVWVAQCVRQARAG